MRRDQLVYKDLSASPDRRVRKESKDHLEILDSLELLATQGPKVAPGCRV